MEFSDMFTDLNGVTLNPRSEKYLQSTIAMVVLPAEEEVPRTWIIFMLGPPADGNHRVYIRSFPDI
jgi:hypothetical protein